MRSTGLAAKFRWWMQLGAGVALVSLVCACGGGGGGGGSSSSGSGNSSTPSGPSQQPIAANAANTAAITLGTGVTGVINIPTVSVTICVPGSTSNCQTVNNIQVDTGSFGLRIASAALSASLVGALPVAKAPAVAGAQLAECAIFADGYAWGTVRTATVSIAGETAASIPVHILGDLSASTVPSKGCVSGMALSTPSDLGANGILGIGVAPYDCGVTCQDSTSAATYSNYYACPNGTNCVRTAVPVGQQVANPVVRFASDNNGVIVQMAPISSSGAPSATGTLVFGIGTESNNTLAAAQTFTTNAYGDLTNSSFNGQTVTAFFDSGSNAYFFVDGSLPLCTSYSGFYCPTSQQTRQVTVVGLNNVKATASLDILSAATLFANSANFAFNDLAGQFGSASTVDIGVPFFFGRYLYYGFDQSASGGQQPYVGY